MAFRTQKISQMTPKGSDLEATDLIEVSTIESGSYVTRSITGQELIDAIPAPSVDWGDIGGTLSNQTDLNTALNGKVPTTRTLTINGTTQDLSADRTFTISTGITIGTTAITSGTVGRVLFEGTGNVVQESANLFWDNTNGRLGIGGTPTNTLNVVGSTTTFDVVTWKSSTGNTGYLASDTAQIAIATAPNGGGSYLAMNTNNFTISSNALWRVVVGGSERMRIPTTGNVLINTTTDAGFRLDVNGTARVQSTLTVSGGGAVIAGQLQANGGLKASVILNNTFNTNVNSATIFQSSDALGEARFYNSVCAGFVSTINASAILQAESTTKGFLPPRMTTTQKNAIASPAKGLQIFDTTLNRPCFYDGTTWITL
jgi:hypothetical protein